jgi:hypothetical protein
MSTEESEAVVSVLRWRYVVRPRKTASACFAITTMLLPPPIMWVTGVMHWTSLGLVATALCGVFAASAFTIGLTYRFQAAKCEQILRRYSNY